MRYASMFAGIGGFDLGFDQAGMTPTFQCDIDPHCLATLDRWWPDTPKGEDINRVSGSSIGRPDVIAGGFPCQDVSVAAPHRRGLDGARSSNYYGFVRLLGEHLRLVDDTSARWAVIENTEGLLRSRDGRDMAAVVSGLEDLGYGWAYRVVDGRHFGTPQRRRRVLIVGCRGGDTFAAGRVLGLVGAGSEVAAPDAGAARPRGPQAVAGPVGPGLTVLRKSARATKSIAAGGWEGWVAVDDDANTLTGFDGGSPLRQTHLIVHPDGRVRTTTLTEWERMQGFPDGHTDRSPRGQRFTQLGNAVHVGMARWFGDRLVTEHLTNPAPVTRHLALAGESAGTLW